MYTRLRLMIWMGRRFKPLKMGILEGFGGKNKFCAMVEIRYIMALSGMFLQKKWCKMAY